MMSDGTPSTHAAATWTGPTGTGTVTIDGDGSNSRNNENSSSNDCNSYESAVAALLHSTTHQSATKAAIERAAERRTLTLADMQTYMERLGLLFSTTAITASVIGGGGGGVDNAAADDEDVSIIHVTGTKGKGSVCAMCEAIMREAAPGASTTTVAAAAATTTTTDATPILNNNTGLFTSPHLVDIRERIRINGRPVSKQVFGQAYWEVRRRLERFIADGDDDDDNCDCDDGLPILPGYFRMLTLVALYIFRHYRDSANGKKISCIILEVGMGGRYDATNCFRLLQNPPSPSPSSSLSSPVVVCGVALIDYDHCRILGNTLPEIAWEKGGIYRHSFKETDQRAAAAGAAIATTTTPHPLRDQEAFQAAMAAMTAAAHSKKNNNSKSPEAQIPRCFALDTNEESVVQVLRLCAAVEGRRNDAGSDCCGDDADVLHLVPGGRGARLPADRQLGLQGCHQRGNAELAVALCEAVVAAAVQQRRRRHEQRFQSESGDESLRQKEEEENDAKPASSLLDLEAVYRALAAVSWPGRCQTVELPPLPRDDDGADDDDHSHHHSRLLLCHEIPTTLRLDGAHTVQSVQAGLAWFQSVVATTTTTDKSGHDASAAVCRILVFNCSHERNPVELLELLLPARFHAVYFCRADSERPSSIAKATAAELLRSAGKVVRPDLLKAIFDDDDDSAKKPSWQDALLGIWRHLEHDDAHLRANAAAVDTASNLTVTGALNRAWKLGQAIDGTKRIEVFVTGSLYLVGSMLSAVQWQEPEAEGKLQ